MNIHNIWRTDLENLPTSDPLWSIYADFCDDNELEMRANGLRKIIVNQKEPTESYISPWFKRQILSKRCHKTWDWNWVAKDQNRADWICEEEYKRLAEILEERLDVCFSMTLDDLSTYPNNITAAESIEFLHRWNAIISLANLG